MKIALETLIEIVTREVIKELLSRGFSVDQMLSDHPEEEKLSMTSAEIDMSGFVTPVLTEGQMEELEEGVREVVIPPHTIITPGAKRLIKQKEIKLIYKS